MQISNSSHVQKNNNTKTKITLWLMCVYGCVPNDTMAAFTQAAKFKSFLFDQSDQLFYQ